MPHFVKSDEIVQKSKWANTRVFMEECNTNTKSESIYQQFSNFLNFFPHFVMTSLQLVTAVSIKTRFKLW